MNVPDDRRYTNDHEWVLADGSRARVGITDYAQDALGDVVFVQLPERGTTVSAGDSFSEVESTKSVSDVYAPVNGSVTEVNNDLVDAPQRINEDPYGAGWICEIEMNDSSEYGTLMDAESYRQLISA
ncbi:MAG: glycine cleavage system protein [Acidimicrobiaceae bacterium]|nr:glycine cleavage system protein [Acidimicrobiaceae bacterium]MDQ1367757.1 glycine cleavage system protein [Acidimicrobiaceae bacterium]MDQ1376769.1 glycine cleavage system protein [Acidimicrobiaceae bacterium]MDQ1400724.1 glycine cleavage system protein [Acidimicrobiaceae bacterium]MDQ1421516.1 glycine cleavage system protein [Acidimicrobiaceae bacterium]